MNIFLDTNIILDFYDSDRGHYFPTSILFDLALKNKIQLTICAQSFITAFYILRKSYPKDELYNNMRSLFKICHVSPVDESIKKALNREGYDFEDTVKFFSSKTTDVDIILTRDKRGFSEFSGRFMTAEEFLDDYFKND